MNLTALPWPGPTSAQRRGCGPVAAGAPSPKQCSTSRQRVVDVRSSPSAISAARTRAMIASGVITGLLHR